MFKVDTILAIFRWIIQLLESTQAKQADVATRHTGMIVELQKLADAAVAEAARAEAVAGKLKKLLS